MSRTMTALIGGILAGAAGAWLFLGATPEAVPAGALPVLPEPYYTVLFENEAVRVVDHQLEVGGSEPEHTHPPMLAYFVEGATLRITEADGSTSEVTIPTSAFLEANDLRWWTHSLENTGDTPLHSILVELKQEPRPEATMTATGVS